MMLQGASDWLYVYPRGLWDLLLHIKRNYNNPLIYITENGTLINMIFFFLGGSAQGSPLDRREFHPTSLIIDE